MGMKINSALTHLMDFWRIQQIASSSKANEEIDRIEQQLECKLPNDFRELYLRVNGMETYYPNEIDQEGFNFYPLEGIISAKNEFENAGLISKENIFIFAEYMQKSWWYGFKPYNREEYVIGIIPHENKFKPITQSLAEFIELYIADSENLYDYE